MKSIRSVLIGVFFGSGLIIGLHLLHAQESATTVQDNTAATGVDWSSASDLQVMLQAVEQTPAIPAAEVTNGTTFWSAQHSMASAEPWPPFPGNIWNLPAWNLGDGIYLLNDAGHDYNAKRVKTGNVAGKAATLDDEGGPGVPGGGSTNSGIEETFPPIVPFSTNGLWLQVTNIANGLVYLNLMNATDYVYKIISEPALTTPGSWSIAGEVFPGSNTNVMPFTVAASSPTNLFIWAMDWTGVTDSGNTTPEWWFWNYFGTTNLSDTNLDSQNNTLLHDFTNHLDPNVIQFSLQFTNNDLNTSIAYGSVAVSGGTPFYEAILVNDTNWADADWQPYSGTNIAVDLTSGNGLYNVQVGLRGLPSDARQSWVEEQLTLNDVTPMFVVTNPVASMVSEPMIQLQGYVSASLNKLTYDVSNAAGIFTNQQGYWQAAFYDTNLLAFTTNSFQCYDVPLTNGLNQITLHATDVAGNTATTNFNYTLDYSGDTNPPVLSVVWPTNGTSIAGSNFTLQAQVDDATATMTASIVDTNSDTNTVAGLVERSGAVWFNGLPLNSGTNTVTITATDAAGNMSTANLTVVQSAVSFTMNPISSDQMNRTNVTVSGTIGDSSDHVIVNGVSATVSGTNWTATNVIVSSIGMASLNARVTDAGNNPLAAQNAYQPQPAQVVLASYLSQTNYTYQTIDFSPELNRSFYNVEIKSIGIHWSYSIGGVSDFHETPYDTEFGPYDVITSLSTGANGFSSRWENVNTQSHFEGDAVLPPDDPEQISGYSYNQTQTHVIIQPSGQQAIGQTALYLVQAQVTNEDSGLQLPGSDVQIRGTTLTDVTNSDGSVWSEALVSAPAGATNVEVTPQAAGNISFNGTKTAKTKEDWQQAVRNEIALDSGGINIQYYLASNSFLNNRPYIKAVYAFYQMVYLEQPTEYYWCGLAKLAGAPVYAGLSDAQNVGGLSGFQQTIMQMNIDILNDLAWQFEAYRKGGLNALEEIYAAEPNALDLNAITAWRNIDQGIQQNNQSLILQGNQALLSREQQQILPDDYTKLSTFDTVLMSIFAKCPVWDSNDVPYYLRDFDTVMFTILDYSSANVANTANRWTWITTPTYGIWDTWVNLSSDDKISQVSVDLRTRAATYSTSSLFTLY
jgi:hypothetical protein